MRGNSTVNLGGLVRQFADQIPLHIASRKWVGRGATRQFATPAAMRFYCLTQTLHLYGCTFSNKPANWGTMVRIKARPCPVCGGLYLAQRHIRSCSVACAQRMRRGAGCE